MTWHFTEDAAAFRTAAGAHLAAEPTRNTVVLTRMDGADRLGWWAGPDGRVTGVLALSGSGALDLGATTEEAARALASRPGDAPVRVRGETAAVEAYARASGRPWKPVVRMRLFRLGVPVPPDPAPEGRHRTAAAPDIPLAAAWTREFAAAIGDEPAEDYTGFAAERISEGRLVLWEAPDGRPVSMAAVSRTSEGQARVHLVYTPPAERGNGYAAGATAAIGRVAADRGATRILLFTDLANPTSNALYQRLGYRPVTDHLGMEFTGTEG
ncbi:GNAT family N-acetyltransferase [Streptomyces sp. NPDC127584]|uniref:GNAT family N-acetyltransferase n=1 Tax=Streptomyces sp. NPDC127584 TaxID=3345403 RepID=UPI003628CCB2